MPADRRTNVVAKPVKTERTHEENQERAYIAASRRSDRSLEARIESARRASEIHKKRTGRGLRVTEQDVINEEMYEEEDDDLPTQYQRLNAHLQTSSWIFNRKLQDYIATQHGVRNMFMNQQFPNMNHQQLANHGLPSYSAYPPTATSAAFSPSMLPPQAFTTNQNFAQPQPQPQQPQSPGLQFPPAAYRHAPYSIPQRPQQQQHQRAASLSTPQGYAAFAPVNQAGLSAITARDEFLRRMSLPPQVTEAQAQHDPEARPAQNMNQAIQQQQPVSPQVASTGTRSASTSAHGTPQFKSDDTVESTYQFHPLQFSSSQALDMNPLSMSLPPESQQLVGAALDPSDPRTSLFMSGSENLPQPFGGTYTYNPNLSPKSSRALAPGASQPGIAQTLAPEQSIKLNSSSDAANSSTPPSAMSDNAYSAQSLFTPTGFEYANFFDFTTPDQASDANQISNDNILSESYEENPENSFVNWDQ